MSSTTISSLIVFALALTPFSDPPTGDLCFGLGNVWFCWGHPSSTPEISCHCEHSILGSGEAQSCVGSSSAHITPRPLWRIGLVAIALCALELLIAVGFVYRYYFQGRTSTGLRPLEISDAVDSRESDSGALRDRSSLMARAHRAQTAAGITMVTTHSRPRHL